MTTLLHGDLDNLEIIALPAPRPVGREDIESRIFLGGKARVHGNKGEPTHLTEKD